MKATLMIPIYVWWHYVKAPYSILKLTFHFSANVMHFFSVAVLLRTLFSPWRRLSEGYPEKFDISQIFTSVIVNSLMRLFGAVVRSITILLGLFFTLITFLSGLVFFVYWLLMPLAVVFLMVWGFIVIFTG